MTALILPSILSPVPEAHLLSGKEVCDEVGKVAFGSRAYRVFEKADELRASQPLDVFFYPSKGTKFGPAKARWHGIYVGHVRSVAGAHPDDMKYRPPSTLENENDNTGHWVVFFEVKELVELTNAEALPMTRFKGYGSNKKYVSSFIPEGPLLVDVS